MSGTNLKAGQSIDTPLGRATVLQVIGRNVSVHLPAGTVKYATIPITDIFPGPSGANGKAAKAIGATVRAQVSAARRTLEALRFGLVPVEGLEDFTIGYDEMRSWTVSRLPGGSGKPMVSEICGPFGTGKSHSMAVIRHVARQEGYVTARVEVNAKEISLSNPEKLLYNLWMTLRGEDLHSATPLLDLYLRAIERNQPAPMMNPNGQDRIRHNFHTVQFLKRAHLVDSLGYAMDSILCSSEEMNAVDVARMIRSATYGFGFKVMRMIGRKVDERPDDFVESLAGHAMIAKLAGFKGLVVTIDEFEVEAFLSSQMMERVRALLNALTRYLKGQGPIKAAPLSIFIASVGQEHHRGDAAVDEMIQATGGDWHELEQLSKADLRDLGKWIFELYGKVYGVNDLLPRALTDTVIQELGQDVEDSGATRAFIKHFMAALDACYGPPAA
jgi:hypothetical protein